MNTTETTNRFFTVADELDDGTVLPIAPGERLWKLYFLRPAAKSGGEHIEHRIYTKEQADGLLALASYTLRLMPSGVRVHSGLARAHAIPEDTLNQLIWNVVRESGIGPDELEVVDLTGLADFNAQLDFLYEQ